MNKKFIFYDMDNTIAEMHKKLTGISSDRVKNYYPTTEEENREILEKLDTEGFFTDLTIIQDAHKVLQKLGKIGWDVRILSQPMPRESSIDEKNYWLTTFMPFIPRFNRIYTFDKYLLAGTGRVLVDDNISHLISWIERGGIGICFQRGYNEHWKGLKITHHNEIFQLLEKLEKSGKL